MAGLFGKNMVSGFRENMLYGPETIQKGGVTRDKISDSLPVRSKSVSAMVL